MSLSASADAGGLMAWMGHLADPTRLRLLRLLEREELGVAELCDALRLPQSTVSRHLKTLGDGGWLVSRREGTAHLYRTILDELPPGQRDLWVLARRQSDDWPTAAHDALRLRQVLAARETARGFFAGIAADWDAIRHEQYGVRFDVAAALALLPPDAVVADFGCGTGRTLADLSPHVGRATGVDASPEMLRAARRRVADLKNVELRAGELADPPIESGSCHAAFCVLALGYVDDAGAVVRAMARVLRPGGRAVIVDVLAHDRDDFRRAMGQRWRGFTSDGMTGLMTDAGLHAVRVLPMPPEADVKGPALFVAGGGVA